MNNPIIIFRTKLIWMPIVTSGTGCALGVTFFSFSELVDAMVWPIKFQKTAMEF